MSGTPRNDLKNSLRILKMNKRLQRPLVINTTYEPCSACNAAIEKIYCIECGAKFCERCFLSTHLTQFSHHCFFSINWPGYLYDCTTVHNRHCFFFCVECQTVCPFILSIDITFLHSFRVLGCLHPLPQYCAPPRP